MKRPQTIHYIENDLFRPDRPFHLNACVGWNGGPYDTHHYAHSYFVATERLIKSLEDNSFDVDYLVYPIVFNFRHAVELSLKALVTSLSIIHSEHKGPQLTHKLSDNWNAVKSYLRKGKDFDPEGTLIDAVDRILCDFLEVDPSGEVFRYPETRKGETPLEAVRCINLRVLGEAVSSVRQAFDHWSFVAGYYLDQIAEMNSAYSW